MDQFGQLALEQFGDQKFRDDCVTSPTTYRIFRISVPDPEYTHVRYDHVHSDDIAGVFQDPSNSSLACPLPSLRIVAIPSSVTANWESVLEIHKQSFIRIISAIGLNPAALWLLKHRYDGFHHFPQGRNLEAFFFGASLYALIWTFDRTTQSTRAIYIQRFKGFHPGMDVGFDSLANILKKHKDHVYSPNLLAYSACLDLSHFYDAVLGKNELSYIHHIERSTGYGPESLGLRERYNIDELMQGLQGLGGSLNNMANLQRHFRIVESVTAFLEKDPIRVDDLPPEIHDQVEHSSAQLTEGLPLLKSRTHASMEYVAYLKERSERLSSILFALLTHEDAATGVKLAASSTRIAADTKRDSSSMKTVAIMTMAFLPGTFFAALLAIPSFDNWVASQDYIWVYWALTIPTTILVFLVWGCLMNRKWIGNAIAGNSD
ncbi:hypothetical protein SLS62_004094 [Diatrype stigma]|uniref:Uncharacterized protein n=1 Tax=Diatrype stigma TaxID=117547 RepID=A0AAN9YU34_9PEZI